MKRFISADTIVPDPTNPQQYNRYSYVLNNSLRYSDPSGHSCYNPSSGSPCTLSDGTGNSTSGSPMPSPSLLPPEPPPNLITHLPLDNITWQSGFGPNWYSNVACKQLCYPESHNIHTGLDFGGNAGDTVYATVSGTIVDIFSTDANPNVVIAVTVGEITYYVVHGHVTRSINLRFGDAIEAGGVIGILDDGPEYPHVHLGLRLDINIENRAYNPLLFMVPELTVGMSFVSERHPYYGNESPTSIRSFLYGTGSFFNKENHASMGIIK